MERVRAKGDLPRATLAGGQGVGQALVDELHWPGFLVGGFITSQIPRQGRHGAAKVGQPPALVVHRAADVVVVPGIHRLRAVDQQRLHQRRAVGALEAAGVKFLHQRQHAADRRGSNTGAGLVPVLVAKFVVLFLQRVSVRLRVGGGDRVFPVGGTGGNNERARRDQVRLEAAERPLDADANVAPA